MRAKHLGILLSGLIVAVAMAFSLTPVAAAGDNGFDAVVYPTGVYPQDLQNVQAAADAGGTVILKATDPLGVPKAFNFGPPQPGGGSVIISQAVTILGESVPNHMTTIRGGFFPIRGIFATGRIVVRGIHFDGAGANAFNFIFSDSAEFSANKISGVVGDDVFNGVTEGIAVFGFAYSGEFVIADNVIDDFDADFAVGIVLIDGAEARILRNEIHGSHTLGISVQGPSAPVKIADNLVVPGAGDPSYEFGDGITCFSIGFSIPGPGGTFHISGNRVEAENPRADGIIVAGTSIQPVSGAVIEGNEVLMHDSLNGAISLYGSVIDSYVGQNRAEGKGAFALQASTFGRLQRSNTFIGNNIARFESDIADVFLDAETEEFVLVGFSGTVIDLGTNNSVTGYTRIGLSESIGEQIKVAQIMKQALWEIHQAYVSADPLK